MDLKPNRLRRKRMKSPKKWETGKQDGGRDFRIFEELEGCRTEAKPSVTNRKGLFDFWAAWSKNGGPVIRGFSKVKAVRKMQKNTTRPDRLKDIGKWWFVPGFLVLLAVGAIAHSKYGLAFPSPWSDESYFLAPAISFHQNWTFEATQLMHPEGIFWMPPMIYWVNGIFFKILNADSLEVARWVSFGLVFFSSVLLFEILRQILFSVRMGRLIAFLLVLSWFSSFPVQLASNLGRPEAISLVISLAALLAFLRSRFIFVISLSIMALLTHPLHALPVLALGFLAGVELHNHPRVSRWEYFCLAAALVLLGCEMFRLVESLPEYLRQYKFQLDLKAKPGMNFRIVSCAFGLMAALALHLALMKSKRPALSRWRSQGVTQICVFGLASWLVAIYGRMMWYGPFQITGILFGLLSIALVLGLIKEGSPAFSSWLALGFVFIALFKFSPMGKPLIALFKFSPMEKKMRNEYESFNLNWTMMAARKGELASLLSNGDVTSILKENGNILVNPFLYLEFLERARLLGADSRKIFTFTSVSLAGTNDFAYYVAYQRAYPEWVTSLMTVPAEILPGHACTNVFNIESENSTFSISVKKLVRVQTKDAVFSDCP